jgi:hypothetical protein
MRLVSEVTWLMILSSAASSIPFIFEEPDAGTVSV